jgi:uncharacterized protein (DUF433 family)
MYSWKKVLRKETVLAEGHPVSLRIPQSGFNDLAALAEHAGLLVQVVVAMEQSPVQTGMAALARFVEEKTGIPGDVARDVLGGLATLYVLMNRSSLSADELVVAVDRSVELQAPSHWREQHQSRWQTAKEQVISALKILTPDSPHFVQQKARELTWMMDSPVRKDEEEYWLLARSLVAKSMVRECIAIDPKIRGGVPVLRGTRISVSQIFAELSGADCVVELADEYDIDPSLIRKLLEGMAIQLDQSYLK